MMTQKTIALLDDTLEVSVFFDAKDCDLADNICMIITETCPEEEKIFRHDESHLYLTREQALALARALLSAVEKSESAAASS